MGTTTRMRSNETGRAAVGRALASGPRTGADLRDTLAVRLGDKRSVSRAINDLRKLGLVEAARRSGAHVTWRLTTQGCAWVAGLLRPGGRAA